MSELEIKLLTLTISILGTIISLYVLFESRFRKGKAVIFPPSIIAVGKDGDGDFCIEIAGVLAWSADRGGFLLDAQAELNRVKFENWYEMLKSSEEDIDKASARFLSKVGAEYRFVFYDNRSKVPSLGEGEATVRLNLFVSTSLKPIYRDFLLDVPSDAAALVNKGETAGFYWSHASQKYKFDLIDAEINLNNAARPQNKPKIRTRAPARQQTRK